MKIDANLLVINNQTLYPKKYLSKSDSLKIYKCILYLYCNVQKIHEFSLNNGSTFKLNGNNLA